jgi:hypothetical protein
MEKRRKRRENAFISSGFSPLSGKKGKAPVTGALAIFLATNIVVLPLVWLAFSLVLYRHLPSFKEVALLWVVLFIVSPPAARYMDLSSNGG